ncbi:MAG: RNA polymerase sigma factor [Pirellulales bacterium]
MIEQTYRQDSRRVLATLIRLLGDFDLAEEAMHEAFVAAAEIWPRDGVPANPRAWLVSTGRFKALDILRRRARFEAARDQIIQLRTQVAAANAHRAALDVEDDRLRLIFTCCHPAISPQIQVPLTLREVCGLTTEEVAAAFLTTPSTMAQRIVRGKAKIRDARIPFAVPRREDLQERLESVLAVVYLVFNEGYSASAGDHLTRPDLSAEAIRLGRLLCDLLPDPESLGLLALMLLQESRRAARTTPAGDLILLDDQDRSLWNIDHIREGRQLVARALALNDVGPYTIQAAIAAVHSAANRPEDTNWSEIVDWYELLIRCAPTPVVRLNHAVAVAMRDGPTAGIAALDALDNHRELHDYHLYAAARADLYRRIGRLEQARSAYQHALALAKLEPERRFLQRRLAELK